MKSFTGPGSTPSRRRFWDQVTAAVNASTKIAGRHVTVDEHPGKGTLINVDDTSARRGGGGGVTGGACCVGETCAITVDEMACIELGGTYQGDGTTCEPNPCLCGCGDTVSATLSATTTGTCDSGIVFNGSGSIGGSITLDTTSGPPIGTAVYCTGMDQLEINDTNSTLVVTCDPDTQTGFMLIGTLLAKITVAGTIYGTSFSVGDWVLLVGQILNDWSGFGDCETCSGTSVDPSVHLVFPDTANIISLTEGGVTNEITYEFSC